MFVVSARRRSRNAGHFPPLMDCLLERREPQNRSLGAPFSTGESHHESTDTLAMSIHLLHRHFNVNPLATLVRLRNVHPGISTCAVAPIPFTDHDRVSGGRWVYLVRITGEPAELFHLAPLSCETPKDAGCLAFVILLPRALPGLVLQSVYQRAA